MEQEPEPEAQEAQELQGPQGVQGAQEAQETHEPRKRLSFVSRWVERRATKAIQGAVSSGAERIEERAARVVGSIYEQKADDLEDRAVRAMRRAIQDESERIRSVIEHSVEVKKREVRLSLLVLVGAAVVYLILYWVTMSGDGVTP